MQDILCHEMRHLKVMQIAQLCDYITLRHARKHLPYFFGYKTGIFPAEITPQNCTRLISKAVGSMPSFHQAQLVMDYMV